MSDTVKLTINGQDVEAPAGSTVLEAAKAANIYIPNLCHNDELKPYGACRLCMVEVNHKDRIRLVTSCNFEVAEGMRVTTDTERSLNVRKLVIELLLARNPNSPVLLKIADEIEVNKSRFKTKEVGCILCGQCVRVCREVVGVTAIGFKGRGITKEVATPFDDAPPDCIACGSCSHICPVGVIPMREKDGVRKIWKTEFPLQKCEKCGRYFAPVKQLEYFKKNFDLPEDHFSTCLHCR